MDCSADAACRCCSCARCSSSLAALSCRLFSKEALIRENWSSIFSVRAVLEPERDRSRRTEARNARRSCFRLAGRLPRPADMRLCAWLMRLLSVFRGSSSSSSFSSFCSFSWCFSVATLASSAFLSAEAFSASAGGVRPIRLRIRPVRRSLESFGAPVANMTSSGSTWNMSPGFSR